MSSQTPVLTVGATATGIYLGVNGRATVAVCPMAERVVSDFLAAHPEGGQVSVDVGRCDWVDSTFAGWLLGLRRRLRGLANARLRLLGCSERCRTSLERMHLAALFEYDVGERPTDVAELPCAILDRPDEQALRLMLSAHEALAGLSPQNAEAFGPVVRMLRRQLPPA
jgi:anti-anti-sigma regulatory factor